MAERPKGNILYEILIVILVAGLLGAIIYPSHVWKQETDQETVCRARMSALEQMELSYRMSVANTYTDSMALLREYITNTPQAVMAMDSLVLWDALLTADQLKAMVMAKDMPNELRSLIAAQFEAREPMMNLGQWDGLTVKLIKALKTQVDSLDPAGLDELNPAVVWPLVFEEDPFFELVRNEGVPQNIARNATQDIQRRGKKINEVQGWDRYYAPLFLESLKSVIDGALREDVYTKDRQDAWEVARRASWEAEMDQMAQAERDSLWEADKRRFWDEEKEIYWMKDRKVLWKAEKESWKLQNEEMWKRIVQQRWAAERKNSWLKEIEPTLSDSLKQIFPAVRDSLWRVNADSIEGAEYAGWYQENQKILENEVIEGLWESARRVSWDETAYEEWMQNQVQSVEFWPTVKGRLWKRLRQGFWMDEEEKLAKRARQRRNLDQAIVWIDALGKDVVDGIVAGLNLPDNAMLWKAIKKSERLPGEVLYGLGVQDMFKDMLIDSIFVCPTAHVPYHVVVIDTSAIKYLNIYCPIQINDEGKAVARKVDPVTKDTVDAKIVLPAKVKLLGGGEVRNHGNIKDERKSWDKKGG